MSVAAQTLNPPSKTLMLLEGRRAFHELGAFFGALPLLSLAPAGDGHPVLVLPGLLASDFSTRPLRTSHRCAAGADHRDLQPHGHGRHLRLAELPRGIDRDVRKHRGRKQPLRYGPSSGRGLRGRRSSGAGRRRMVAVRSLWLAQPGLSGSAPVNALLLPYPSLLRTRRRNQTRFEEASKNARRT